MSTFKSKITDEMRAAATQLYHGDAMCQEKSKFLLTEVGLPNGLLPLKDIEETGYIEETGFVWLIQKQKSQHKFEKINSLVQYAKEITAYVEPGKIKKLTGVTTREFFIWITLCEIDLDNPPTGKINFRTPAGLSRSFPVEAFVIEEEKGVPVEGEVDLKSDDPATEEKPEAAIKASAAV